MTIPNTPSAETRLQFAVDIARQAGDQTLELFRTSHLGLEQKSDGSPVTNADRQAEQTLRDLIEAQYPDDAILGEEFGEKSGKSGFQWVLDPIDGTKAFVTGVPLYTTLVAVLWENEPLIGIIYAPAAGEMVYAARGSGCWHILGNKPAEPAKVSQVSDLSEAVFLTTSVHSFTKDREQDARPSYDRLQSACRISRTWGDAFGYLLVATGRAEIMIDPKLSLWDAAALQPVIEEAGGKFFDWNGTSTVHSEEAIATNGLLKDKVLELINH